MNLLLFGLGVALFAYLGVMAAIKIHGNGPTCVHTPCRFGVDEDPMILIGCAISIERPDELERTSAQVRVCEKCGALYVEDEFRPAIRDD